MCENPLNYVNPHLLVLPKDNDMPRLPELDKTVIVEIKGEVISKSTAIERCKTLISEHHLCISDLFKM